MQDCETCGMAVSIPFKCNFCGGIFCVEHRLPEAHACRSLSDAHSSARRDEPEETVDETYLPRSENEPMYFDGKVPREEILSSVVTPKPKGRNRIIVALCILVIAAPIAAAYFSYHSGYNSGFSINSASSYDAGFAQGDTSGYARGYTDGNSSGYGTGYDIGYTKGLNDGAGHGFTIRDPTYQEMLNFIGSDQTDKNIYVNLTYVCWDFAADVIDNAFNVGYRCGFVYIELTYNQGHAIVSFNTIDRGIVFIEPQNDNVVTLTIGEPYSGGSGYLPTIGEIVRYQIVW